jgi:uncharacterized surface protein with fasciclin (FAS1) repeats
MIMKHIYILLASLMLFSACTKDDHELSVTGRSTLLQYISNDPQLTLFKAALQKAGMLNDSVFTAAGPYTICVPVDSAMQVAGLTADKISTYDPAKLAEILQYHFIYGRLSSTSLIGFYTQDVRTQNLSYRPTFTKNYYGIFLNGIPFLEANIIAGDGIIHKLGRVALPPVGTLEDVLLQTPDLSMFAATMHILGYDESLKQHNPVTLPITGLLDSTFTMFTPTDAAFKTYGFKDVADLEATDPEVLKHIFNYYFKRGNNYTAMMKGGSGWGTPAYTYDEARFYYVQEDGLSIKANGNISLVHITRPDIVATNGVVHVVDQVIIP